MIRIKTIIKAIIILVSCVGIVSVADGLESAERQKNDDFTEESVGYDIITIVPEESVKSTKFGLYEVDLSSYVTHDISDDFTKQNSEKTQNRIAKKTEALLLEKETELTSEIEELETNAEATDDYYPVYSVAGVVLDEDLQRELYFQLKSRGIEWWMKYALMMAFQESGLNPTEIDANGLDMGLFQFRSTYWRESYAAAGLSSADILNPYDQIYVYTYNVSKRLSSGKDIYTVISDHYTGEQSYNANYVSTVLGWENAISQLK